MKLINTEEGLLSVVEKGISAGAVALDTEFVWEKTYYPMLGCVYTQEMLDEEQGVSNVGTGKRKSVRKRNPRAVAKIKKKG